MENFVPHHHHHHHHHQIPLLSSLLLSSPLLSGTQQGPTAEGEDAEAEKPTEPVPSASATTLSDTALEIWLRPWAVVPDWEGQRNVLGVLRDELTTLQELTALEAQPVEASGTGRSAGRSAGESI